MIDDQDIHIYLEQIRNAVREGDEEEARALERELYEETLMAIAGGIPQPVEMARLALTSTNIPFAREVDVLQWIKQTVEDTGRGRDLLDSINAV